MALPTNTGAFIHNGVNCTPNVIQTAQGVPYDNTSSGLSATNVQAAINEVLTRTWTGTQSEYDALPTKDAEVTYFISDSSKIIKNNISYYAMATSPATVATSGSYDDLSDTPTIPDISTKVSKSGDTMTGDLKWEINGRQGIVWKEYGYGDKFEIRPYFSGADDSNYLAITTATGGAGTDPGTTDKFKFYPSGNSMFLVNETSYNYTAASTNSPAFISKATDVDASKGNNNISSGTYYPCYQVQDSSGRILARVEGVLSSSGTIGSYWYVRNYDTSGTMVGQKGISMTMDKRGALTYSVAEPDKFRSAIGAVGDNEYKSNPATIDTTYVTVNGIIFYRTGRSVFVKLNGTTTRNVSGRTVIGTIPAGFRPITETASFGLAGSHYLFEPNGEIKCEGFNGAAYESSAYLWSGS